MYRLLIFRGNRLDRWAPIEAANHLEAIEKASAYKSDDRVELWCRSGRIAAFRPLGRAERI